MNGQVVEHHGAPVAEGDPLQPLDAKVLRVELRVDGVVGHTSVLRDRTADVAGSEGVGRLVDLKAHAAWPCCTTVARAQRESGNARQGKHAHQGIGTTAATRRYTADEVRLQGLNQGELEALGERLGTLVTPGVVLLLEGSMGAGKTTFTRALARGMKLDRPDRVCSPTFNICLTHTGPVPLLHVDLFRLAPDDEQGVAPASFEALGLDALLDSFAEEHPDADAEQGVLAIEWSNLWQHAELDALTLRLSRPNPESRDLEAIAGGERHAALLRRWDG